MHAYKFFPYTNIISLLNVATNAWNDNPNWYCVDDSPTEINDALIVNFYKGSVTNSSIIFYVIWIFYNFTFRLV